MSVQTKYTYSNATDFSGGFNIDRAVLDIENNDTIVTALDPKKIEMSGDVIDIWFKDVLSSGEKEELDGSTSQAPNSPPSAGSVLGDHSGVAVPSGVAKVKLDTPHSEDGIPQFAHGDFPTIANPYWPGIGDDFANGVRGGGQKFYLEVADGNGTTGQAITLSFVDSWWVVGGEIDGSNLVKGKDAIRLEVRARATPFPAPSAGGNTGNANLFNISFVNKSAVKDKDLATPPGSPAIGDRYIVAASPTGDWASNAGKIAEWSGYHWVFYAPSALWTLLVADEGIPYHYNGAAWAAGYGRQNWQAAVKDKDLTAPPGSPTTGDRYLVPASATGDWATHDNEIADWNGSSWDFTSPTLGMNVYIEDEGIAYDYITSWAAGLYMINPAAGDGAFNVDLITAHPNLEGPDPIRVTKATPVFVESKVTPNGGWDFNYDTGIISPNSLQKGFYNLYTFPITLAKYIREWRTFPCAFQAPTQGRRLPAHWEVVITGIRDDVAHTDSDPIKFWFGLRGAVKKFT